MSADFISEMCLNGLEGDDMSTKIKYYDDDGHILKASLIPGYQWICQAPGYMGGQPSIFGKRISVGFILECIEQGMTPDEIAEDFELTLQAVQEAIHYASDVVQQRAIS